MQLHKLNVEKRLKQGRKENDEGWKLGDKTPVTGKDAEGNLIGGSNIERPEGKWLWLPIGSRKDPDASHDPQKIAPKGWADGIVDIKKQSKYLPTEYIYGPYSINPDFQDIYHNDDFATPEVQKDGTQEVRIFRGVDRIKLMMDIIATKEHDGGAELSFATMKNEGALTAFFPIHDYEELWQLETEWIRVLQVGAMQGAPCPSTSPTPRRPRPRTARADCTIAPAQPSAPHIEAAVRHATHPPTIYHLTPPSTPPTTHSGHGTCR